MRKLKDYTKYLREERLRDLAECNLRLIKEVDIPLVKLMQEKKMLGNLEDEATITATMESLKGSLTSLENGTAYTNAKKTMELWADDKLPGIGKYEIHPADLILVYSVQKKSYQYFLPQFTKDAEEAIAILAELEEFQTRIQTEAIEILFKIQAETEQKRRLLIEMLEATPDFVGFADAETRAIQYINSAGRRMIGVENKSDITKLHIENVHPEWVNKLFKETAFNIAVNNGIWMGECAFLNIQTGKEIPVLMVLLAHKDATGNIIRFSTISRNITEQKIFQKELEQKTKELERSNAELEQFAYVASHDLQEPLRTISSYVQLIASRYKDKLDPDANEFIEFAVDGSRRMRQLINSLLEYSRINRVKPFEWVNVDILLKEIMHDISDQVKETKAVISCKNMPEVFGDYVLLGQLFQNLISNAIKFRKDVAPEINITCEEKDTHYLFCVKDNGIGIPKEYREKVFVIFQRLNNREKYPGTGIGLSICKKIVEKHGGNIWIESEPGKGTSFFFTLKAGI